MSGSGWDISSWEAFSKSHDDLKLFSKGQTTNSRTKIATWKEKMSAKTTALISPIDMGAIASPDTKGNGITQENTVSVCK